MILFLLGHCNLHCVSLFFDQLYRPVNKSSPTDKKDIGCIQLYIFLVWMFSASLRGNVTYRAFKDLSKSLLYSFTRNIAGDRYIVCFPADFINFININDSALCSFDIMISSLQRRRTIFSTSSPTYPASVRVVASAIAKEHQEVWLKFELKRFYHFQ